MGAESRYSVLLARILMAKHGTRALVLAAERVQQWARIGDEQTASLWVEVVGAITESLPLAHEPALAELLDGQAISAMMGADGVQRDHIERLAAEVRRRLAH